MEKDTGVKALLLFVVASAIFGIGLYLLGQDFGCLSGLLPAPCRVRGVMMWFEGCLAAGGGYLLIDGFLWPLLGKKGRFLGDE